MAKTEYYLLGKKVTAEEFGYFKAELTFSENPESGLAGAKTIYAADPDGRQFEYREKRKGDVFIIELDRMPEENY